MSYKAILPASVFAAAVCFSPFAGGQESKSTKKVRAANVFAENIEDFEFASKIEALGTLEPKEQVNLTINDAGPIARIFFDDGERVKRGQRLLSLVQTEQRALVDAETANVAEAQQQLDRVNRLILRKAVSQSEVDVAQRDLNNAQAQLTAVQSRQTDRDLKAPFSGVLGFRRVSVGAYMQPGDLVATLIDDSHMKLEFSVPSIFKRHIKLEDHISAITDDYPDETFKGVVKSIDNVIDPVTRTVKVRAIIPNDEKSLLTGMSMKVVLEAQPRLAPAIAEEAVQSLGPQSFVYQIKRNDTGLIAVKTEVKLGTYQNGYVEVLSGIDLGDQIVSDGLLQVRNGGPVNIQSRSILDADQPSNSLGGAGNVSAYRN